MTTRAGDRVHCPRSQGTLRIKPFCHRDHSPPMEWVRSTSSRGRRCRKRACACLMAQRLLPLCDSSAGSPPTAHGSVEQGEGGEQGDAFMPLLFFPWANMLPLVQCRASCGMVNGCSRSWTTCTSSQPPCQSSGGVVAPCPHPYPWEPAQVWMAQGLRPNVGDLLERLASAT